MAVGDLGGRTARATTYFIASLLSLDWRAFRVVF
jgi:hypothetical protein